MEKARYAVRASRFDAILVIATACTAIFISVEDSVLVGVLLSIVLFVPKASQPGIHELVVTADRVVRERRPDASRRPSSEPSRKRRWRLENATPKALSHGPAGDNEAAYSLV